MFIYGPVGWWWGDLLFSLMKNRLYFPLFSLLTGGGRHAMWSIKQINNIFTALDVLMKNNASLENFLKVAPSWKSRPLVTHVHHNTKHVDAVKLSDARHIYLRKKKSFKWRESSLHSLPSRRTRISSPCRKKKKKKQHSLSWVTSKLILMADKLRWALLCSTGGSENVSLWWGPLLFQLTADKRSTAEPISLSSFFFLYYSYTAPS